MLNIKIATPEKKLYEGQNKAITVKTSNGVITILSNHIPLLAPIANGYYKIDNSEKIAITKGMLTVDNNSNVTILVSK